MTDLALRTLRRILWLLIVLADVALNVLLRGRVETVSARASRARDKGTPWGCWLCRLLDKVDPGHCDQAAADPLGPLD